MFNIFCQMFLVNKLIVETHAMAKNLLIAAVLYFVQQMSITSVTFSGVLLKI